MSPDTLVAADSMTSWEVSRFGLANLAAVRRPVPRPGAQEILVRVAAVSLNYRDKLNAEGILLPDLKLPYSPASDAVGEVAAIGSDVTRFRPGDRVVTHFITDWIDGPVPPAKRADGDRTADGTVYGGTLGGPLPGVLSDYILLHEESALPAPASLSNAEAATLPIAALTAWFALFETATLKPGDTVLVQGTGGVSLFGLQFATAAGARAILTSRDPGKLARAKALGAVAGIDTRRQPEWDKAMLELTGGRGADHILELVGGENLARSVRAAAPAGRISQIGILAGLESSFPILPLMLKQVVLRGIVVGHRRAFEAMNAAIEATKLKPVIDAVYPFDQVPQAFAHLDRGPFGKVVIEVR